MQENNTKDNAITITEWWVWKESSINMVESWSWNFDVDSIVNDIMWDNISGKKATDNKDIDLEEMPAWDSFDTIWDAETKEPVKETKAEEQKQETPETTPSWELTDKEKAKEEIEKELNGIKEKEEPVVEKKTEWEVKQEEPKKKIWDLNTEDLIKQLEAEINKDLEENNKVQEDVKNLQDKMEKWEDYTELVTEFNDLVEELDNKESELTKTKDLLLKYKQQIQELWWKLNQNEVDFWRNEPILNTVNADRDLKWFVLATSKSEQDPKYKDVALDYVYNWLQKQTGVDIKNIIWQENESSKDGMSGNSNNSSNSFKAVKGKTSQEGNIIQWALDSVREF